MMTKTIELQKISNQQEWESLVLTTTNYTFLQSWQFGLLQESLGKTVDHLAWIMESQILAIASINIVHSRRGVILQLRHAPLFFPQTLQLTSELKIALFAKILADLKQIAKENSCDFIRIQTLQLLTEEKPIQSARGS